MCFLELLVVQPDQKVGQYLKQWWMLPSEQSTMDFSIFCFWVMIGGLSKPLGRKDQLIG